MWKQRETASPNNDSLAIQQNQGPFIPLQETKENILGHVLGAVLQALNPPPGGRS